MDKLSVIRSKILPVADLEQKIPQWSFLGRKIVFTNGCFDILHRGHIEYLAKASEYGDILVVGLNSDKSVRSIKGPSRPVQDEDTRALILASLSFVEVVILFDEDTPLQLIQKVQPDILVKGADYKPDNIVGYDVVKAKGGEILTIELTKGHSSTGLITKLSSL